MVESASADEMSPFVGLITVRTGIWASSQCACTTPVPVALGRVIRMKADAGLTCESAKTSTPSAARAIRIRREFMIVPPPLLGWWVGVDLDLAIRIQAGLEAVEEGAQRLIRRGRGVDVLAALREELRAGEVVAHHLHAVFTGGDRVLALLQSHHPRISSSVLLGQEDDYFLALLEARHSGDYGSDVVHRAAELTKRDRCRALRPLNGLKHAQRVEGVDLLVGGVPARDRVIDARHHDGVGFLREFLQGEFLHGCGEGCLCADERQGCDRSYVEEPESIHRLFS